MTTDAVPTAAAAPRAGRREWIGLAVLALPTLLVSMDFSVLYLALPHLSADLSPSSTQQLWIVDIYGFVIAGFLVTMGTLGDRIGRRKLLLIGAAGFGLALMLAAFSTSAPMLIVARALLGVAGATLMPSTLALISNMFPHPEQKGLAITAWLSCFMGGLALGPVVGGLLLHFFWWGSVFLVGVPIMLLLLALGPVLLPEHRDPGAGRLDLLSVAVSLAAILPFTYGVKELARNGWRPGYLAAVVLGVAFGVVFVLRQRRLASPLLDLRLFGNRTFRSALVILMVAGIVGTGTLFLVSLYLQTVAGLSPLVAGLWLVPATLLMIVGNMLAPRLARRFRPAYVIAGGLVVGGAGYLLLSQVRAGALVLVLVAWLIAMTGNGPMGALGNMLVLTSTPPEKTGSAAAITQTGNEFGFGLGIAVLGSIGTVVYRHHVAGHLPAGLPAGAAGSARDSISDAVAVSGTLPPPLGHDVLVPAREAFTAALHTVGTVAAVLYAALAVLAVVALRHVPASGAGADAAQPAVLPAAEVEAASSAA